LLQHAPPDHPLFTVCYRFLQLAALGRDSREQKIHVQPSGSIYIVLVGIGHEMTPAGRHFADSGTAISSLPDYLQNDSKLFVDDNID